MHLQRRNLVALVALLAASGLVRVASADDESIPPGSIGLYGKVVSVNRDGKSLVLSVQRFHTPTGSQTINPTKNKTVLFDGAIEVSAGYGATPPAAKGSFTLDDLEPGRLIFAVGPDSGSGRDLQACRIVIGPLDAQAPAPRTLMLGKLRLPADPDDYTAYRGVVPPDVPGCPASEYPIPDGFMLFAMAANDSRGQLSDDGLKALADDLRKVKCPVVLHLDFQTKLTPTGYAHLAGLPNVVALSLDFDEGIDDQVLEAIAKVPNLRALDLCACPKITPAGYAHLAGLPNVIALSLQQNQGLNDQALEAIAKVPNLRSLELNECHSVTDTGVKQLAKLKGLQYLNVAKCERVTAQGVRALRACPKLASLNLWGTSGFTDVSALGTLPALREVTLCSDIPAKSLAGLATSRGLHRLVIDGVGFAGKELDFLTALTSLEDLSVNRNPLLRDLAITAIGRTSGLKRLDLSGCEALAGGFASLSGLTQLETLDLSGCRALTDKGLMALAEAKTLKTVRVAGTGVTKEGIAAAEKLRPGLTVDHD